MKNEEYRMKNAEYRMKDEGWSYQRAMKGS
jgi:hypothetical protein